MSQSLDVTRSLQLLNKLKNAAPQATAVKLEQIMRLLQDLSDENAYLNARIHEGDVTFDEPVSFEDATPADEPPAAHSDETDFDILVGVNDALRPPLVAVRGRAELLLAGMLGQITGEQAQWLHAIDENTVRAFRVLDALQRLIAIKRDQIHIEWSNFVASDLLEEAYTQIKERAAAAGHTVVVQVSEVVPVAQGDFHQSLLILNALLDNAVRYTPEGGQIRLSVDNLGTHVLFNVADSGIGLYPEDMQHIGQPFWRGDHHPLVRQHTGSGLSLYLVRHLLALQGGEFIFSGEPDLGSTFSFTLNMPT